MLSYRIVRALLYFQRAATFPRYYGAAGVYVGPERVETICSSERVEIPAVIDRERDVQGARSSLFRSPLFLTDDYRASDDERLPPGIYFAGINSAARSYTGGQIIGDNIDSGARLACYRL